MRRTLTSYLRVRRYQERVRRDSAPGRLESRRWVAPGEVPSNPQELIDLDDQDEQANDEDDIFRSPERKQRQSNRIPQEPNAESFPLRVPSQGRGSPPSSTRRDMVGNPGESSSRGATTGSSRRARSPRDLSKPITGLKVQFGTIDPQLHARIKAGASHPDSARITDANNNTSNRHGHPTSSSTFGAPSNARRSGASKQQPWSEWRAMNKGKERAPTAGAAPSNRRKRPAESIEITVNSKLVKLSNGHQLNADRTLIRRGQGADEFLLGANANLLVRLVRHSDTQRITGIKVFRQGTRDDNLVVTQTYVKFVSSAGEERDLGVRPAQDTEGAVVERRSERKRYD